MLCDRSYCKLRGCGYTFYATSLVDSGSSLNKDKFENWILINLKTHLYEAKIFLFLVNQLYPKLTPINTLYIFKLNSTSSCFLLQISANSFVLFLAVF